MSLLSRLRTPSVRPQAPLEPATAMEVGGLQLECAAWQLRPVRNRQVVVLAGSPYDDEVPEVAGAGEAHYPVQVP